MCGGEVSAAPPLLSTANRSSSVPVIALCLVSYLLFYVSGSIYLILPDVGVSSVRLLVEEGHVNV